VSAAEASLVRVTDPDGTVRTHAAAAGLSDLLTLCGMGPGVNLFGEEQYLREHLQGRYRDVTCQACRTQIDLILRTFGGAERRMGGEA
jgi:hypothetical protein